MNYYKLVVNVRQVGAIGIFYPQEFYIFAHNSKEAKNNWFAEFGKVFESRGFGSVIEVKQPIEKM